MSFIRYSPVLARTRKRLTQRSSTAPSPLVTRSIGRKSAGLCHPFRKYSRRCRKLIRGCQHFGGRDEESCLSLRVKAVLNLTRFNGHEVQAALAFSICSNSYCTVAAGAFLVIWSHVQRESLIGRGANTRCKPLPCLGSVEARIRHVQHSTYQSHLELAL